jgi:6,7-dimethyl-8-ribityllumazine synthase
MGEQTDADPAAPGREAEEAAGSGSEQPAGTGSNFAICVGTFYEELAEKLVNGAIEGFDAAGVSAASVRTFEVPGAFELPLAARWCAESGRFAGVACLGAVIRGETDHYDYVCTESARGIQQVQLETGVPCAFGVITCETMEQAFARAGGEKRNQGRNAARAVVAMARLRSEISAPLPSSAR